MEFMDFFANTLVVTILSGVVVLFGILLLILQFLKKVNPGFALIITKPLGNKRKVSFTGAIVVPIIHKVERMDISTKRMVLSRKGGEGLICKDNIRADIIVNFYVRVNQTENDVLKVAESIGCERASAADTLDALFSAKFSEALKTAGKQLDFEELFGEREKFKQMITEVIGRDLNGYSLEDTAIDYLEQTPVTELDSENIMDSEGIKKITELTSVQHIKENEFKRTEEEAITKRDVEARERILVLEKQKEEAEAKQKAEVEIIKAREEAEAAKVKEDERLKAETAKISTEEQLAISEENKLRQIAVAEKNKDRTIAVESERIEKDRLLEVTERDKVVTLAQIEKEKLVEQEKKNIQEVIRQRVAVQRTVAEEEEKTKDIVAHAGANREKAVAITNAEKEAEEAFAKDVKAAEAKAKAADFIAKEKIILADTEKDTAEKIAESKKTLAEGVIAEEAASGLARVKVKENDAEAERKVLSVKNEAREMEYVIDAKGIKEKGEAEAHALEKMAAAEATGIHSKGEAEAHATEKMAAAEATGIHSKGEAEAFTLKEKLTAEATGVKEKAEAMKILDEAGRDHEEFKLKLQVQENIDLEKIRIQKDIAAAQSQVLASALKEAKIDIVGGETQFFNNIVKAISDGKAASAYIENNTLVKDVKDALLSPEGGDLISKITGIVKKVGLSSEDLKNLSIASALNKMSYATKDKAVLSQISGLAEMAKKAGVNDMLVENILKGFA